MKHIIHSYHPKFSGGIGDFIRGSIELHKICKKNNIFLHIDWSKHTIGSYVNNFSKTPDYDSNYILDIEEITLRRISKNNNEPINEQFKKTLFDIIKIINEEKSSNHIGISSYFMDFDYSVDLLEQIKNYQIQTQTTNLLKKNINTSYLIKKEHQKIINKTQNYGTIHFRLGDRQTLVNLKKSLEKIPQSMLNNANLKEIEHDFDFLYFLIERNLEDNNLSKIILLSDCNKFKKYVSQKNNSKIIITHFDSVHSSCKPGLLKYTKAYSHSFSDNQAYCLALDLECLINSKINISYSIYSWGSGFTIWPSKIFNVPLKAYRIETYHYD